MMDSRSMRRSALVSFTARVLAAVILASLLVPIRSTPASAAPTPATSVSAQKLSLLVRDVVYNPVNNRLYASVPAGASTYANSVVVVDPGTGAIKGSVSVGIDPNRLALSDDGAYLYVGLDGESSVRQVDLSRNRAGLKFPLYADPPGGKYWAKDIAVVPGDPHTVAIAMEYVTTDDEYKGISLALYTSGQILPDKISGYATARSIEFCGSATTLYAEGKIANSIYDTGFYRISVGANGLAVQDVARNIGMGSACHNGLLYSSNRATNPRTRTLLGTYRSTGYLGPGAVSPPSARVYQLYKSSDYWSYDKGDLYVYKQGTYQLLGKHQVSGLASGEESAKLVMAGSDHLALVTHRHMENQGTLHLVHGVQSLPATGTGIGTTSVTTDTGQFVLRNIGLPIRDAVYSKLTGKLYVSVPGSGGTRGNSIVPVDPSTGALGAGIYVGSEPHRLALSADGRHLWVGLAGAAAIRRVDLVDRTRSQIYPLGRSDNGWYFPSHLAPVPGKLDTVAVSLHNDRGFSPNYEGVAVYAGGRRLINKTPRHQGPTILRFCGSTSTLYGFDDDTKPSRFYRMLVSDTGVVIKDETGGLFSSFDAGMICDAGLLYMHSGRVMNPQTKRPLGRYVNSDGYGSALAVDAARSLVYGVAGSGVNSSGTGTAKLSVWKQKTFQLLQTHTIPELRGVAHKLMMTGSPDRMAMVTFEDGEYDGRLYLIHRQSAGGETPTVSLWAKATTAPAGQFAPRKLNIPVADVAYSPLTKKLYVSVSGKEGLKGNSILEIDAFTGGLSGQIYVGSEPGRLAVAPGGRYLWVGIDGANSVRRVDLVERTVGIMSFLGYDNHLGLFHAADLAGVPNKPDTVAVSFSNCCYSPEHQGVALFRNGVRLMNWLSRHWSGIGFNANSIEFCGKAAMMYGAENEGSGFNFYRMNVDDSGVTLVDATRGVFDWYYFDILCQGRLVVTNDGQVIDPDTRTQVARYPGVIGGLHFNAFVHNPSTQRMHVVSEYEDYDDTTAVVKYLEYNAADYSLLSSYLINGVSGRPDRMVKINSKRLALWTDDRSLYLLTR